ncbi:alkaline phosphatase family protein [Halococcus hamelinensis]|uniref:alkaline phosphatase family protein n=1 Tax=Halococcus hamelinensis TaxID=332168 RepID=UPI001294743A
MRKDAAQIRENDDMQARNGGKLYIQNHQRRTNRHGRFEEQLDAFTITTSRFLRPGKNDELWFQSRLLGSTVRLGTYSGRCLKRGDLPNLSQLMEDGFSGTLYSTVPSRTSPAIPSLYTGCDPSELDSLGSPSQMARRSRLMT